MQVVRTNQFSVTKHKRVIRQVSGEHGLPGMVQICVPLSFAASLESKFSFAKIWEGKGEGVLMIAQ